MLTRFFGVFTVLSCLGSACVSDDMLPDDTTTITDTTSTSTTAPPQPISLRIATFNASLAENGSIQQFQASLLGGGNQRAQKAAEIIQRINPDILILQEFDYDPSGTSLTTFNTAYLQVSQNGAQAITFIDWMQIPTNTGLPSGVDFNNNGSTTDANDAYGFGNYEGQYGFSVLSKYALDKSALRTFQEFLWADMPNNVIPNGYFSAAALDVFRLSSKNHIDLPVLLPDNRIIHVLAAHPTPPVFDGAEDRNGRRNHDEIRLLADYISLENNDYLVDDTGTQGGIDAAASFVVAGDMNADPIDGDSFQSAILQLLNHARINPALNSTLIPSSPGGAAVVSFSGSGDKAHLTASFNLRVDYVLPSADLEVTDSGVFWPANGEDFRDLVEGNDTSDHRLVWVDVVVGVD